MEATLAGFRVRIAHDIAELLRRHLEPLGMDASTTEPWARAVVGMATAVGEWWMERRPMSREELGRNLTAALWWGFSAVAERAERTEPPMGHTSAAARGA